MASQRRSLLAGRNRAGLTREEIRRVTTIFLGLDRNVNARHEPGAQTAFHVSLSEEGEEIGEVVFGPDIYPGRGIVDANSSLSVEAAAAHELTHFHRWKDKAELSVGELTHLDEALTSLQAIQRYDRHLSETDVRQLISDAIQRIHLYLEEIAPGEAEDREE